MVLPLPKGEGGVRGKESFELEKMLPKHDKQPEKLFSSSSCTSANSAIVDCLE